CGSGTGVVPVECRVGRLTDEGLVRRPTPYREICGIERRRAAGSRRRERSAALPDGFPIGLRGNRTSERGERGNIRNESSSSKHSLVHRIVLPCEAGA